MPILLTLLMLVILIPAGLAGIGLGLLEILSSMDQLVPAWQQLVEALSTFLTTCTPLACLAAGTVWLGLAALLVIRGLQSRP